MTDIAKAPTLGRIDEPDLLVDRVVHRLRSAILDGSLVPGAHLSVPELALQLGVSRTPVREAIYALERAGLVVVRPRRGAVVFGGGSDELRQLFELREALDGMAARLAAERMTDAERDELVRISAVHDAAMQAADVERHIDLDLEFHRTIRDSARNRPLATQLDQLRDQIVLVMRSCSTAPGGMGRGARRDHHAIRDALIAADPDAAEAAARAHVRNILRFVTSTGLADAADAVGVAEGGWR